MRQHTVTGYLACEVLLRGDLCDDKDMISSGAAALGGCFAACHADSSCEYFGLETVPNQCCNKLSEVLLEVGKFGLSLRFRGLR